MGWTGRALAAGPALLRPRPCPLSAPGSEEGRSVGERVEKRGRICSLFAQSRRLWWVRVAWLTDEAELGHQGRRPAKINQANPVLPRETRGRKRTYTKHDLQLKHKYPVQ